MRVKVVDLKAGVLYGLEGAFVQPTTARDSLPHWREQVLQSTDDRALYADVLEESGDTTSAQDTLYLGKRACW